jgi:O-acetyl-ADP-ribose deacetylase (regulator of RNase III)
MEITVNQTRVEAVHGDITAESVDAIVNAANAQLAGGGGVDGAIHRAGGPSIMAECRKLGGCPTGEAKATTAGQLNAQWVIHTVGPIWQGGARGERAQLASAYRRSLEVAAELGAVTVAFPAISCGVYGYPIPEAARVAVETVKTFAEVDPRVRHVRFVLFGEATLRAFQEALRESQEEPAHE